MSDLDFSLETGELFDDAPLPPVEQFQLYAENGYDSSQLSLETGISFPLEEDLAVQGDKDDADINVLVARFGIAGEMPPPRPGAAFGDFSEAHDFQSAMDALVGAQNAFYELPARVREEFGNDPARLIQFVQSSRPSDIARAREMGLIPPEPPAPPAPPPPPGS